MSEKTITIKKSDLWKYSTFVLIAVVVIGAIFVFTGNSSGGANPTGNTGNSGGGGENVDLSVFENNPSLFPSLGPENSDNVVIKFSDFQCSHCTIASGLGSWTSQYSSYAHYNAAGQVKEAAENGELRFVYVPMSFLGQESVWAAQAGLCANQQDKFWEMHDAIFEASDSPSGNTGKYSKENLKTLASSISGLDTTEFNSCLDNDETLGDVQQAAAYARTAASGTPTFYVNGQQVSASWSAISAALK